MVYIAAALKKDDGDASNLIKKMLLNTIVLEGDYIGVSSSIGIEYVQKLESIKNDEDCLMSVVNNKNQYPLQPLFQGNSFAFEGYMFQSNEPDAIWIANKLRSDPKKGITKMIKENVGAFSIITVNDDLIMCGRDIVGTIPLYFGENSSFAAVANNKKMLWSLNLEPEPVEPGTVVKISKKQNKIRKISELSLPRIQKYPENVTIETIDKILKDIATMLTKKNPEYAISFSGGIDSTLVAHYLKESGATLDLICVGINQQKEYSKAKLAADYLDLPLKVEPKTPEELESALPEILRMVEDPNLMKIGVAAPLFFSAKEARKMNLSYLCSGNGSDELFGGYKKYLRMHLGGEDPRMEMYNDLKKSWKTNFDRDTKVCRDVGVDLILPFAHPRLIEYGLSLPLDYLLPDKMDKLRKIIIRKLAKSLGIPDEISYRPKRAAQYSSGVQKTISKIAKKYGKKPWDYLDDIFVKMKKSYL
ncbi:hypothetical protein GF319_04025 [Candidatus Bathyarchaeota archaeon]|nr:hypothetical protein [Candidatus Bathyarchaeota archaeon]